MPNICTTRSTVSTNRHIICKDLADAHRPCICKRRPIEYAKTGPVYAKTGPIYAKTGAVYAKTGPVY